MGRVKRLMDKELLATDTVLGTKWATANIKTMGFYIAKEEFMNNEQTDNLSNNSTIMDKAQAEWLKWAYENNINTRDTTVETYTLMHEAFVDGYTNGFVKRFTEGE